MNDIRVSKGLVIDAPWISLILSGQKDWEMRSTGTSHRGWFGLIWKGMGSVYGVARLAGAGGPMSPQEMIEAFEHHRIPEEMIRSGAVAKWNRPWFLADVVRFPSPVRYKHPNGAVTWVELSESVSLAIRDQIAALADPLPEPACGVKSAKAFLPKATSITITFIYVNFLIDFQRGPWVGRTNQRGPLVRYRSCGMAVRWLSPIWMDRRSFSERGAG